MTNTTTRRFTAAEQAVVADALLRYRCDDDVTDEQRRAADAILRDGWTPLPAVTSDANGVVRCSCGCKYWVDGRCVDCDDPITAAVTA